MSRSHIDFPVLDCYIRSIQNPQATTVAQLIASKDHPCPQYRNSNMSRSYVDVVPEAFYVQSIQNPQATTVAQLIEILQTLPPEMPVTRRRPVDVVVYDVQDKGKARVTILY